MPPFLSSVVEPTRNEQVLVTTSSSTISDARSEKNPRKTIFVRNISADTSATITVNPGFNVAVANKGIVLLSGESFEETSLLGDGKDIFQGMYTAICSNANGILSVMER